MLSDEDLIEKLKQTVVWNDLRAKLVSTVRDEAHRDFLRQHWPANSAPRETLYLTLRRDNAELVAMLLHATETLLSMNVHCPDFVDRLIRSGINVPEHWRAV